LIINQLVTFEHHRHILASFILRLWNDICFWVYLNISDQIRLLGDLAHIELSNFLVLEVYLFLSLRLLNQISLHFDKTFLLNEFLFLDILFDDAVDTLRGISLEYR
jgi:hypothetical protein